jgi:hypothetical protein
VTGAKIAATTITQAKMAASSVGQGQLKTTTGEVTTISATGSSLLLPGGEYGFDTELKASDVGVTAYIGYDASGAAGMDSRRTTGTTYANNVTLSVSTATTETAYAKQRYVQASPPYDLGDGEIPEFIFVEIDTGTLEVVSTYIAPEAPWHYNGPTDIRATHYRDGKSYRLRKDMSEVPFTYAEAQSDPLKLSEYLAAFREAPEYEEELTQLIKNADMNIIPHPMLTPHTGCAIVLLDPVADNTWKLAELSKHDQASIAELLYSGRVRIDNTPLNRAGPSGVQVVGFSI